MEGAGITWIDLGDWIEHSYSAVELQEYGRAERAEGVEQGIKIGETRAVQNNGHITLPEPFEMAEYCHDRLNRLRNDWQRDFIINIYALTQRRRKANLSLPRLADLAKIYIEIGGRI
jgi:hypothetical protein